MLRPKARGRHKPRRLSSAYAIAEFISGMSVTAMLFNDLLAEQKIDHADVLVLRHTPRPEDGKLKEVFPWLAAVRPNVFNAFQQTQTRRVEAKMLRAKFVASFIGLEKRHGRVEHAAVFVGLYKVGEHRPLTYNEFWEKPAYQELK
jgi:hypothetical protein